MEEKMYLDSRLVTRDQLDELEAEGYNAIIGSVVIVAWR